MSLGSFPHQNRVGGAGQPVLRVAAKSAIAVAIVGLACLAWGGWSAWRTHRFTSRAARAEGTVFYAAGDESNTLLVEIRSPSGELDRHLPVHVAWWTPPWCYNRGDKASVLYDPGGDYDAPLFRDLGRVDTWMQLWSGSVFWCAVGILCMGAAAVAAASRGRFRFSVGLRARLDGEARED